MKDYNERIITIPTRHHFPPSAVRWKGIGGTSAFYTLLLLGIIFFPFASSGKCINTAEIGINHSLKRHIIDEQDQKSMPLTLAVSDRVSQRITTNIFKIFLQEVIGYEQVVTVKIEDHLDYETTLDYLNSRNQGEPYAMINAELWLPPGFFESRNQDCGSQGTGARYGWYVRKSPNAVNPLITDHWRSFLNENIVSMFFLSPEEERKLEKFTKSPSGKYFCPEMYENKSMCTNGIFVPSQCKTHTKCATLFVGDFHYSYFLPSQVKNLKLLVQIAWIGPNLTPEFLATFRGEMDIAFFSWWPNPLSVLDNFVRVSFPLSNGYDDSYLWKYEFHSIRKRVWKRLEEIGQLAFETLQRFSLEEEDYRNLLTEYNTRTSFNPKEVSLVVNRPKGWDDALIEDIACDWLRNTSVKEAQILNAIWPAAEFQEKTKLWIAGIFPVEEEDEEKGKAGEKYSSKEIIASATFAQDDVNKNTSVLKDYNLELFVQNGGCDADSVLYAFFNFIKLENKNMVGILGPGCSDTVEPLAGLATRLNMIIITFSAEGAMFNNYANYPYFFRTIPENKLYRYVYLELFKELKWKQVAAITESGNNYSEYLTLLQDLLQFEKIEIFNRKIPRGETSLTSYLSELKEKRRRIIIGDFYTKMSCQVICEAYNMDMTAKHGYIWFLPNWLPDKWYDIDNRFPNINCTTENMLEALDGHLSLGYAYLAPDDYVYHQGETVGKWKERYYKTYNSTPVDYSGYSYDAVWTYALALDKLLKESFTYAANLHSDYTQGRYVELIRETNFKGVSGQIEFSEAGPSRKPSTVNIMQFNSQEQSYRVVGQFTPNETVENCGVLQLNNSAFEWFTEDGEPPSDGSLPEPSCALEPFRRFMGVSCEFAIIITMLMVFVIFVILVIIAFMCYKARFEKMSHYRWQLAEWMNLEEWEIPKERVVTNRIIGEGAFGTVYGGECQVISDGSWGACAVKTLKLGSTIENKLDFLSEAEMMKRFSHDNIVKLIGLSTRQEPLYMIMEFMLYGNLKTYLLGRRHLVSERTIFDDNNEISNRRLTSMALDVAKALEYLSNNKYVHRDVACRNCLVSADRLVKLCDFGMTRQIYEEKLYYKFERKGWLPLRWMAPECLEDGIFTTASDMWSYGVLLYEIITFGNFPFQHMNDAQVLSHVKGGGTLRLPVGIRPELESLLYRCWRFDPSLRCSFSSMVEVFSLTPRLIMPCLEIPLASVQTTDPDIFNEDPDPGRRPSGPRHRGQNSISPSDHPTVDEPGFLEAQLTRNALSHSTKPRRLPVQNGRIPAAEPLLSNNEMYVGKYACLELKRSPDGSDRVVGTMHHNSCV